MSTVYCPKCGGENNAESSFCGFCREPLGAAAVHTDAQAAAQQQQPALEPTQQFPQQPTAGQPQQPEQPAYDQPQQPAQPTQPAYGQPAQSQQQQPAQPPYGQPQLQPTIQQQPPKKGKGLKIALFIIGGLVLLLVIGALVVFGVTSCTIDVVENATNEVAEADYYEIGGDKVPSVKLALGRKYDVTGYASENSSIKSTLDIVFKTSGASNEEMSAYSEYLSDQGWLRTQDCDWTQTSRPKSQHQGFQMAKNSIKSGYVVVVTLYYEPGTFNLVIDRVEGDVSSVDSDSTSQNSSSGISSSDTDDLWAPGYFETLNGDAYYMSTTMRSSSANGVVDEEIEVDFYVNGKDTAMVTTTIGVEARFVFKDNKSYMIVDSEQIVYVGESVPELLVPDTSGMTFVKTGEGKFMGRTLYCETWKNASGNETQWFFDTDAGWIEGFSSTSPSGELTEVYIAVLEVNYDKSVFTIPANYQTVQL